MSRLRFRGCWVILGVVCVCACVNGTFGLKLCQFKLVWFQRIQLAHFTLKLRDNNNLPLRHDGLCDILNLGQFQCCRMHREISRTPMRRQPAPHSEVFAWAARADSAVAPPSDRPSVAVLLSQAKTSLGHGRALVT